MLEGEPGVPLKKSFNDPDKIQDSNLGQTKLVVIGTTTFRRSTLNPGCREIERHEGPHILFQLAGRTRARMDSGIEEEFKPGEVGKLPSGHTHRVTGNKRATILEITGPIRYIETRQYIVTETTEQEKEAARKRGESFIDAINTRNARDIASYFTENADYINSQGKLIQGKREIERYFALYLQNTLSRDNLFRIYDSRTRFIRPNISSVDLFWHLVNTNHPSQPIPYTAGMMNLLMIENEGWEIDSLHSINLIGPEDIEVDVELD